MDPDLIKDREEFAAYQNYIESLRDKIPAAAYEFASADWHYDTNDARCPHDAWLEELKFGEIEHVEKYRHRPLEIYVKLLGAYHNGHLELRYKNIYSFSFNSDGGRWPTEISGNFIHGDWHTDRIRLSENGFVVHEIEWDQGRWIIEAEDIEYEWTAFDPTESTNMIEVSNKKTAEAVYESIHAGGAGCFLQSGGFIEVSGGEAIMFLNGLITNDVAKLEENTWMPAAFPNAQGRLLAAVRVLKHHDKFLFVTDPATYEKVLKNLERFTMAGDFQVRDRTKSLRTVSIRGEKSREILGKVLDRDFSAIKDNDVLYAPFQGKTIKIIKAVRENGFDIIIPGVHVKGLQFRLKSNGAGLISDEMGEILRIERGIPLYDVDMNETTIVPELGLDGLISYNKGCYIGQEIIARIHFRGHVAKQLRGLIFDDPGASANPGDELQTADGKNAGKITSVAFSPAFGKTIALGFVRYDYLADGTELKAGGQTAIVKNLPFVENLS